MDAKAYGRTDRFEMELYAATNPLMQGPEAVETILDALEASGRSRNAIVVERFAGYGQTPGIGTFCDAIQDELLHQLAQLPGVRIFASVGSRASEPPEDDRRAAAGRGTTSA